MGTAASAEPCVYERLWESIAVLRESGHRYGMSERDIERFITQVLQTNEPQDLDRDQDQPQDQPAFPLLRATAKCALALCLLLVLGLSLGLGLGLGLPQSPSGPLSLGFNWTCPLGAARLLDLPIAHKYNLRGYRGWWGLQRSEVNTSVCVEERRPIVVKGGADWTMQTPEQLHRSRPQHVLVRTGSHFCHYTGVPAQPANYSVHWSPAGGAAQTRLFPEAQPPLLDTGGSALRRCVVWNLRVSPEHLHTQGVAVRGWLVLAAGRASLSVSPLCPHHRTSRLQLRPGDRVFCDPRLWRTELIPGPDQTIFCDGSAH